MLQNTTAPAVDAVAGQLVKFIPFTKSPRVEGLDLVHRRRRKEVMRIVDTHDIIDTVFDIQKQGIVNAFDVYSDIMLLEAMFQDPRYSAVSSWKIDLYASLFALSQVSWTAVALYKAIEDYKLLVYRTRRTKGCSLLAKLWVSNLLNAPTYALTKVLRGIGSCQSVGYSVTFVPERDIRNWITVQKQGLISQTVLLVLEDIPLLVLNMMIARELGHFTFVMKCSFLFAVLGIALKSLDIISYWRLRGHSKDEVNSMHMLDDMAFSSDDSEDDSEKGVIGH